VSVFSIILVVFYAGSVFAAIAQSLFKKRFGDHLAYLLSFFSFMLAASRPESFPDVLVYEEIYNDAATGDFSSPVYWLTHSEPGFKILSYTISLSGLDFRGLLFFIAIFSFLLLIIISRIANTSFAYLWFTYFSLHFITRDLGQIRLSIASHLLVIAILQHNTMRSITLGSAASFAFQYFSLVVVLIAKMVSRVRLTPLLMLLLVFGSILAGNFINFDVISVIAPQKLVDNYAGTDFIAPSGLGFILPAVRNLMFLLLFMWIIKGRIRLKIYNTWAWMALLSVCSYLLLSGSELIAQRFAAYFSAIIPLAFGYLMNKISDSGKGVGAAFAVIILFFLFNFIVGFYLNTFVWGA
jgi:hypothetical protein